jgi:hypothetical protein
LHGQKENPQVETEGSPAEAEEGSRGETRGLLRESSAGRSEEDDGWQEESQSVKCSATVEEGRADAEGLFIGKHDSLKIRVQKAKACWRERIAGRSSLQFYVYT